MKTLRLLLLLMLTLAITLCTFTSCDQIEEIRTELRDLLGQTDGPVVTPATDDSTNKVDPATCGHYVTTKENVKNATCTEGGYTGDDYCYSCGTLVKAGTTTLAAHSFKDGTCSKCGATEELKTITVAEALQLATTATLNDVYLIRADVASVTNAAYGAMIIADETGEISIYNTKNHDGTDYSAMTDKPYKGDTVLIKAVLHTHNGTPEIAQAYIVEFTHNQPDINPEDYALISIADARLAADDTLVKVQGVVARITFANGMIPSGFYLIDGTSSIYVYDGNLAARVAIGNTVTVVGAKDHWILDKEQDFANKFGYQGCNQLTDCVLVENDNGNSTFNTSWITETTVKDILETPITSDISTLTYKVNALVKKVVEAGYTNYYLYDLDGKTGTYVYTQCNGSDFAWLDKFDGKICTVYISAMNAKSSAAGCSWRFLPVEVIDEGFVFDTAKAPEYAVKYHGLDQFLSDYTADPELELVGSVSSPLLGFEGVTITYTTSNDSVVFFTVADGKTVMHTKDAGTATITVTATFGAYTYSDTVTITVSVAEAYDYITVEEAIATPVGETVIVKGIVGPSLVNKVGFYLMGETGLIAVETTKEVMALVSIGNEVIISATRNLVHNQNGTHHGQTELRDATLLVNNLGNHEYNDSYFVTDKSISDFYQLDVSEEYSTTVFVVTGTLVYTESGYSKTISLQGDGSSITLYCGNAQTQYGWASDYFGQTVTVEVAACNWNNKKYYAGCILSIILDDGTKIYNTCNW